ncbi:MAG: GyrI-like domain-containing protein, partial [bacterium]
MLKEAPPTWIAAVKSSLSTYEEAASTFEGLFQALAAFLRKQGVRSTGPAMALYHETEGQEGISVEAALPLASSLPSRGEVSVRLLEGVERMASVVHRGAFSNLSEAYHDLFRWVEENGYLAAGSPRELYLEFQPGGNPER